MRTTQDEHIPHQASIAPVVETKPIKWGWIEDKNEFGFTPDGNISLDWIQVKLMKEIDELILNNNPDPYKMPYWWYDNK